MSYLKYRYEFRALRLTDLATPGIMKKLFTGLLALVIAATPVSVSALTANKPTELDQLFRLSVTEPSTPIIIKQPKMPEPPKVAEPKPEPAKPQPVVYTVVAGDNLTKIGTAFA